jgi:hypothetical protein
MKAQSKIKIDGEWHVTGDWAPVKVQARFLWWNLPWKTTEFWKVGEIGHDCCAQMWRNGKSFEYTGETEYWCDPGEPNPLLAYIR